MIKINVNACINLYVKQHVVISCIVATLGFIIVIVGACIYANSQVIDYAALGTPAFGTGVHQSISQTLVRYDAQHFVTIAQNGYQILNNLAFLPLYILAIRLFHSAGLTYSWSGLLVSWLALCAASVIVYLWAELELKDRHIKLSPWLVLDILASFPTALYFVLPYTESLFLLLNVSALYCFRKQRYIGAAVLAALVAATRYQGIVLSVFFITEYLTHRDHKTSTYDTLKQLLPIVGSIVGLACYMIYLTVHFHSPFAFLQAEKEYGRLGNNPILSLVSSLRPLMLWFVLIAIFGLIQIKKYLGQSYFWYSLAFMALPLASGRFDSFNRYLLCLSPLMLALAVWYNDKTTSSLSKWLYASSSCLILGWYILLFANGYWVG